MTEIEKQIYNYIFVDKLKASEVGKIIGYSERQIYRIKKKLKEDNQL